MSSSSMSSAVATSSLVVSSLFSVAGKTILVTGGGKGIGQYITNGFVQNGAKVFICGRDESALQSTAASLNQQYASSGGSCTPIVADLAKPAGIQALYTQLTETHGVQKLHVLVNNSGVAWGESIRKHSEKGWDRVFDLNVKSLFFVTKAMLPLIEAAGKENPADPARIINIGSVAGVNHQVFPTHSYDASKAAVHSITRKLAMDLPVNEKINVTVNSLSPGYVPSQMSASLRVKKDQLEQFIPCGRVGSPEDMAGAALFLASRAGAWVNGAILIVDGGQLCAVPRYEKPKAQTQSKL